MGAWLTDRTPPGTRVMLMYPAGLAFFTAFLGCLYAGRVAVPAPLPDTDRRALQRAEGIIRDADVGLVLSDAAHRSALGSWLAGLDVAARPECVATDGTGLLVPDIWSPIALELSATACIQYTSGSTSEPRGVLVTHRNLLHSSESAWPRNYAWPSTSSSSAR